MSARELSFRYAAFYAAIFGAVGVYIPFWPLWLGAQGLSAAEISLLLAVASWLKVLTTPGFAQIADRSGHPKTTMIAVALLAVAGFALLPLTSGFWGLLAVSLIALAALQALPPLGDSQTLAAVYGQQATPGPSASARTTPARTTPANSTPANSTSANFTSGRLDYGRIRLWGSLGFIAAAAAAGPLVERFGITAFLPFLMGLLVLTLLTVIALPGAGRSTAAPSGEPDNGGTPAIQARGSLRPLLRPRFMIFLLCASLLQASHAAYYAFSTIEWRAAGHSESVIGLLWAEGVIAEVLLFAVSTRLAGRLRPSHLLLAGAVCGLIRWLTIAETTWLPALFAIQVLHAGTFGATHLGAMHFIARRAPKGSAATAQSLYAAISGGLAMGLALLLAGELYGVAPHLAFYAMAALTGIALLLALRLLSFPASGEQTSEQP